MVARKDAPRTSVQIKMIVGPTVRILSMTASTDGLGPHECWRATAEVLLPKAAGAVYMPAGLTASCNALVSWHGGAVLRLEALS